MPPRERHPFRGQRPVGGQEPALAEAVARRLPVVLGPAPADQEQAGVEALARRQQHVDLATVEPGAGEEGDVTVAAVLAERRGRLPQGRDIVVGTAHVAVGGEERPSAGAGPGHNDNGYVYA